MCLSINNLTKFQGTNENMFDYGGHSGSQWRYSTFLNPGKSGSCHMNVNRDTYRVGGSFAASPET